MWTPVLDFYNQRFKLVIVLTFAGLMLLAWLNRFIQDDAFISFRYADNLARGMGLVWNPGYRIEGYTNFLWTLLMSGGIYLGFDPVIFSQALSIALFLVTLTLTYKLASLVFGSRNLGLLTVVLLGTNYTFSAYASAGGLETQMQALTFVAAMYLLVRSAHAGSWQVRTLALLSLVLSAALLTRLDSSILVGVTLVVATYLMLRQQNSIGNRGLRLAALVLPLTLLFGGWLAWKLSFYGELLPNTFYVKGPSSPLPLRGIYYVYIFFLSYFLVFFLFLFPVTLKRFLERTNVALAVLASLTGIWLAYVILVNGDFMEFRFLVPVLPFIMILVVWVVQNVTQQRHLQVALVLLVLVGSGHHGLTFGQSTQGRGIESISRLSSYIEDKSSNWAVIGKVLGKELSYNPDVTIATTAAGAIPYYSRLGTIDMLGLNDRWVARHGEPTNLGKPGHNRVATLDYLVQSRVNIVISHPWLRPNNEPPPSEYSIDDVSYIVSADKRFYPPETIIDPYDIPDYASILEIPIDADHTLVTMYLTKSDAVDDAIERNGWVTHPIVTRSDSLQAMTPTRGSQAGY